MFITRKNPKPKGMLWLFRCCSTYRYLMLPKLLWLGAGQDGAGPGRLAWARSSGMGQTLNLAKPKGLSSWEWQWDRKAARHTGTLMQHLGDRSHDHRNRTITYHPTETPKGRKST